VGAGLSPPGRVISKGVGVAALLRVAGARGQWRGWPG
jgi:hypothetical protein